MSCISSQLLTEIFSTLTGKNDKKFTSIYVALRQFFNLEHMKVLKYFVVLIVGSLSLFSCGKDEEIDVEKPVIDLAIADAFPQNCETLYFDEPFTVKVLLTDNVELGSYNIDIHNNFDHHTHSTETEDCLFDDVKTPENPYVLIKDYAIPTSVTSYETELSLIIPSSDGANPYDDGDYHFHLSVTDKEGWSSQIGLNVKILRR